MKVSEETAPQMLQTAMFVAAGVGIAEWQIIYDRHGVKLGGFPGVHYETGLWALEFFKAEPDKGDSFDYIESVDWYTTTCVTYAMEHADMPNKLMLEEFAKTAIERYSYNGTHD